jgi:hypothetical protein
MHLLLPYIAAERSNAFKTAKLQSFQFLAWLCDVHPVRLLSQSLYSCFTKPFDCVSVATLLVLHRLLSNNNRANLLTETNVEAIAPIRAGAIYAGDMNT